MITDGPYHLQSGHLMTSLLLTRKEGRENHEMISH